MGSRVDDATAAVVCIHGRGATANDILSLSRFIDRDDIAWLAPQAAQHTWYPYSFLAPLERNESWLSSALGLLDRIVTDLAEEGIAHEKTVLVGFSQGACLASEYVARHAMRFGGLVAFSGGLIGSDERDGTPPDDKIFEYEGTLDGTPVFLGCSDIDAHIPVGRVHETARVFEELGGSVVKKIYPGMGHTINDDEIRQFQSLMDDV